MKNTHLFCSHVRDSLIGKSPGDPGPESMLLAGRKHLFCSHVRDSLIGRSPGDPGPESMVLAGRKASLGCRAPCDQHGSRFVHSRTLWLATGRWSLVAHSRFTWWPLFEGGPRYTQVHARARQKDERGSWGRTQPHLVARWGFCRFFRVLSSKRGLYLHLETELGRLVFDIASQEVT